MTGRIAEIADGVGWFVDKKVMSQFRLDKETLKTLRTLRRRNKLIPRLLQSDQVFIEHNPIWRLVVDYSAAYLTTSFSIKGVEHAQVAEELAKTHPLTITPTHASHIDSPLIDRALEEAGCSYLRRNSVYIAGLKMDELVLMKGLAKADDRIRVPTPENRDEIDILLRNPNLAGYQEELLEYQSNLKKLGYVAVRKTTDLVKQGRPIIVYIEGGRRTDEWHRQPDESLAVYARLKNKEGQTGYILPAIIEGAEAILPTKQGFKFRRASASVILGEPYEAREVSKRIQKYWNETGDFSLSPADVMMAKIARLTNFDRVRPDLRPKYQLLDSLSLTA